MTCASWRAAPGGCSSSVALPRCRSDCSRSHGPGIALFVLATFFAVDILIDGVSSVVGAVQNRERDGWWLLLLLGLLGTLVGAYVLFNPPLSLLVFVYTVAFQAVAAGVLLLALGWKIRQRTTKEWILYVTGVLSISLACRSSSRRSPDCCRSCWSWPCGRSSRACSASPSRSGSATCRCPREPDGRGGYNGREAPRPCLGFLRSVRGGPGRRANGRDPARRPPAAQRPDGIHRVARRPCARRLAEASMTSSRHSI